MSPQTQAENKSQKNPNSKDGVAEDEIEEEIIEMPQRSIYDKIYELAEKFAATRMGQIVTEKGDGVLKVIEDTAKWSVPQKNSDSKLERPLSWIPFLSLIITLRILRVWLSLGALMIGNSPVSASDMVYFVQTRRRKLRAVRMHGAKTIRRREREASLYKTSNSNEKGLMGKLRKLMSRAICRPGQHSGDMGRPIFMRQPEASDAISPSERQAAKRPRDDSCNDPNLTIDQMLQKYANEDSEDDSDYVPNPEDETNDDSSTLNSSSATNSGTEENNENSPDEEENHRIAMKNKKGEDKKRNEIETEPTSESDNLEADKQQSDSKAASNGIDKPQPLADNKQNHSTKATSLHRPPQQNSKPAGAATTTSTSTTNGHDDKSKSLASSNETSSSSSSNGNKPMTMNSTAMAGSPTDFSTCFLPQTIPKPTNAMNSHSTPKSAEENAAESQNQTQTQTQTQTAAARNRNSQRQNFYPNNRNRGRNHQRRHF